MPKRDVAMARKPLPALRAALAASLLALLPLAAGAQEPAKPAAAPPPEKAAPSLGRDALTPAKPAVKPYLDDATAPDTVAILPAPPPSHSAAETADRTMFNATRERRGSVRWELATADVAEGSAAVLDNMACVLGTRLDPARVPALIGLLDRARLDVVRATRGPKVHYRRLRPFVGNEQPICVQRSQALADSYSYPSGHASQGWTYALILASLVPQKATAILARGRAYGESRVICGVHWLSDVEAGRTNGSAVYAALQGNAAFRADLDRARAELAKAMSGDAPPQDPKTCAREDAAAREPAL